MLAKQFFHLQMQQYCLFMGDDLFLFYEFTFSKNMQD